MMGFHVTNVRDPEIAPVYCFNHAGTPAWAGKTVDQMTGPQCAAMFDFCRSEGMRQGWNQRAAGDESTAEGECLFHEEFAQGAPFLIWCMAFKAGQQDRDAEVRAQEGRKAAWDAQHAT